MELQKKRLKPRTLVDSWNPGSNKKGPRNETEKTQLGSKKNQGNADPKPEKYFIRGIFIEG